MRSDSSFSMRNFLVGLAAIVVFPVLMSTTAQAAGSKSSGSHSAGASKPRATSPGHNTPSRPAKSPGHNTPSKPSTTSPGHNTPSKPSTAAPHAPATHPKPEKPGQPQPDRPKPEKPEQPKPEKPKADKPQPERVKQAVDAVNPMQPKYLKHDITGDKKNETFCNWFVMDVGKAMGHPKAIPGNGQNRPPNEWGKGVEKPLAANQLNAHFRNPSSGWKAVTKAEAAQMANNGQFVVGSLVAKDHGHVAVVVPGSTAGNMRVAQAGLTNSRDMAASKGFAYYVYTGK
jgi:outer membrane biosynthesis protein TonB